MAEHEIDGFSNWSLKLFASHVASIAIQEVGVRTSYAFWNGARLDDVVRHEDGHYSIAGQNVGSMWAVVDEYNARVSKAMGLPDFNEAERKSKEV